MLPLGPTPDRTSRAVRLRPVAVGLVLLAGLAGLIAVLARSHVLGMLMVAMVAVVVWDVVTARLALHHVRLAITNPVTAIVGEAVPHVVDVRGMTQPLVLVRPTWWAGGPQLTIAVRAPGPGTVLLDAPARGVQTHLVLDVVAPGPLGLAESAFREQVTLPIPLHVAPPPLAHDPRWPSVRTIPFGESTTVARGEDLFRGVRAYTRGDPRRSIHWPATAHHGALMVKEHDGLEHVALRVVVALTHPGPAAEAAVARAAFVVDQALARGWVVHLVTAVAPPAPPAPLARLWSFARPAPLPGAATETVERRIARPGDAHQQLAAAGIGPPTVEPWTGLTRLVTPEGDEWT